jgi:hypothetical protein
MPGILSTEYQSVNPSENFATMVINYSTSNPLDSNSSTTFSDTVVPETALPFADTLQLSPTEGKDISGLHFSEFAIVRLN